MNISSNENNLLHANDNIRVSIILQEQKKQAKRLYYNKGKNKGEDTVSFTLGRMMVMQYLLGVYV